MAKNRIVYIYILFVSIISTLLFVGCKTDSSDSGVSVLPESDAIVVRVDTFGLKSSLKQVAGIYSKPDSFLLGEVDNMFGTIHADILTQFACPIGFEYPKNAQVDSVCLFLFYNSWYGDGNSPMTINVFALDKGTFSYTDPYKTDIELSDYWSEDVTASLLENPFAITAAGYKDSVTSNASSVMPYLRLRLTDSFASQFFAIGNFETQKAFNEAFNGIYISSDFGSASMLYLNQINLAVYYHYSYTKSTGIDTTIYTSKSFYSNAEVRQVNRISYIENNFKELSSIEDSISYVVSPSGISTVLDIPLAELADTVLNNIPKKRPYVNRALLTVDVCYEQKAAAKQNRDDWAQPADYMMLIVDSLADEFFLKGELPSSQKAIVSSLSQGVDSLGNTIYYYSYDLANLLTAQLRQTALTDTLRMKLIPVDVQTAVSSASTVYYTSVKPKQTISATTIRSAQNKLQPMKIEVIYSGF